MHAGDFQCRLLLFTFICQPRKRLLSAQFILNPLARLPAQQPSSRHCSHWVLGVPDHWRWSNGYNDVDLMKHQGNMVATSGTLWSQGGYKDGLQPESLADGNWLVKQSQPVSKIETNSDTNLISLYKSWFRNAFISKSVILWWQVKKGINLELEGANTRRVLNIPSKRSLYLMRSSHTSTHLQKKSTCFSSWTSPHSHLSQARG